LSVFVYHGHSRNVDPEVLAKHDVVLTSYGMVKKQFPSRKRGIVKEESDTDDLKSGPIALVKWYRIVLDEAHVIRNRTSQVAGACWKLEAEKRWCITVTPMQNGIDDLYSYLCFLRYKPYTRYSSFRSMLKEHNSTDASVGRNKLQIFLGIILLRRTIEFLFWSYSFAF
jgi:SNF2 family DNA or RNA helicase